MAMKRSKALAGIVSRAVMKRLPDTLADITRMSEQELQERGVSRSEARKIVSAFALAKEIAEPGTEYRVRISSPLAAKAYCRSEFVSLRHAVQEEFWLVTLDTKNQPIATHLITKGTLKNSLVHPREVFRPAIQDAANCILVVHNHPSGDPKPSEQDIQITKRLEEAAEIIGIPVIDHIIIAGENALSIQEWRSENP